MVKKIAYIIAIVVVISADLFWGTWQFKSFSQILNVIELFRFKRIIAALIAGCSLGVSGLILQTIFENPLAGPYILGISNGAAFGVALASFLAAVAKQTWLLTGQTLLAFIGAASVLAVIIILARRFSTAVIIITGILLAGVFSALINLLIFFSPSGEVKSFVVWTMASMDNANADSLIFCFLSMILLLATGLAKSNDLDNLYYGRVYALSFGTNVKTLEILFFALIGLNIAIITTFYGPIALIGVISPHIARTGSRSFLHKDLILLSAFWGSFLLVSADFLSHVFGVVVPLNTVLSLIGIPILIYFIIKGRINFSDY